jgi:hypothetical protein
MRDVFILKLIEPCMRYNQGFGLYEEAGGAQGSEKVHGIRRRLSKPVWPHSPQLESPLISRRSLTLKWTICGCST